MTSTQKQPSWKKYQEPQQPKDEALQAVIGSILQPDGSLQIIPAILEAQQPDSWYLTSQGFAVTQ